MSGGGDTVDYRQLRAARAILGLSLPRASQALCVSISALVRAERSSLAHDRDSADKLQRGYERNGIVFTNSDGVIGVSFPVDPSATEPT